MQLKAKLLLKAMGQNEKNMLILLPYNKIIIIVSS
jgi:hypothetical protein